MQFENCAIVGVEEGEMSMEGNVDSLKRKF